MEDDFDWDMRDGYDDCEGCESCNSLSEAEDKGQTAMYEIEYVIAIEPHLKTTRTYYEHEKDMLNDYECLVRNGNDIIWCGKLRT